MFGESVTQVNPTPNGNGQQRVYLTSLKSITASSPSRTSWSTKNPASPPSPARQVIRRLLWPRQKSHIPCPPINSTDDEPIIISDSISSSKRLQNSIMLMAQHECRDENENKVRCCKQEEAHEVIRSLQKKAEIQIDEGKLHGALLNLSRKLALQQKLYGKKNPEVALTLNAIGQILSNLGEDSRYMAMSALEESLAIRQDLEPGSEDTATTLKNLWLLLHESNIAIVDKNESTIFQDFH
mmetsp:Transcript_29216/g.61653  ORF Transcript_29216/g.61653 Transcript_29216/m.61653 type:complete len:240 (+) Transcript_29216:203-922(+)